MANKVGIVGIVGVPAKYGGFETLVENLLNYQELQISYTVFCSKRVYKERLKRYKRAELKYVPLNANGLSSVFYDAISLIWSLFLKLDKTLILGVSGGLFIPIYKIISSSEVICNIDGIEWKRAKWNRLTKVFLKISESVAVRYSDVIITDNEAIADYVKTTYQKNTITIAYGGNRLIPRHDNLLTKYNLKKSGFAFKVCRIEPENNIELILRAFQETNLPLVIVGNWNSSPFGKKLKKEFSSSENFLLLNPIYDELQLNQLRINCKIYIHGHSAGGTNPSLVEAMALQLPIIAFDVIYNRYTLNNYGWYFKDKDELTKLIQGLDLDSLKREGSKIYTHYKDKYTWSAIAEEYNQLFK